ncbi:MAG: hypothetical protein H7232_03685 [Aeromicrobium sp.]|nr:hypothetical protein [Burkholderiales bacterium]
MNSIRSVLKNASYGLVFVLAGCGGGGDSTPKANPSGLQIPNAKTLAASQGATTSVVSLVKVSETRVSRTVYDYVFRVVIQNGSAARAALTATALSAGLGTTVISASVLVGDVGAGSSLTPEATITLRHDRAYQFNGAGLAWTFTDGINGVPVPPEPNATQNNSTIAGVDTNKNGIRDDVERSLATRFGGNLSEFKTATQHASTLQAAITGPTELVKNLHVKSIACAPLELLRRLKETTLLTLNTSDRRGSYGEAFAGVEISNEGCGV